MILPTSQAEKQGAITPDEDLDGPTATIAIDYSPFHSFLHGCSILAPVVKEKQMQNTEKKTITDQRE